MKMRKTLKYGQLIAETLTQLTSRFNPKVPSVKKAIDVLIEREYIKRQESSFETIEYIA
jgi:cullin 1